MTITLTDSNAIRRSRALDIVSIGVATNGVAFADAAVSSAVEASFAPCAPAFAIAPAHATTTTATMNSWLGGDVQAQGFGSTYATKRNTPGRLEGVT